MSRGIRRGGRIPESLLVAFAGIVLLMSSAMGGVLRVALTDRSGAPLMDAVVFAHPSTPGLPLPEVRAEPVIITQENLQFEPYVTVVRVGMSVAFVNRDKHEHHIKSFGPAKEFEFPVHRPGLQNVVVFDKAGGSAIICYLHGWMRTWVYAVDTPYFGKTDSTGTVTIPDIVDGDYEIRAWHPDTSGRLATVKTSIRPNSPPLAMNLDLVPRKRLPPRLPAK